MYSFLLNFGKNEVAGGSLFYTVAYWLTRFVLHVLRMGV